MGCRSTGVRLLFLVGRLRSTADGVQSTGPLTICGMARARSWSTRAVRADCLRRDQIRLIASGRSTEQNLTVLRRHLAECARCRAAVAARAGGVRGPGDTVLLKR